MPAATRFWHHNYVTEMVVEELPEWGYVDGAISYSEAIFANLATQFTSALNALVGAASAIHA